jgi:hypothetical protein
MSSYSWKFQNAREIDKHDAKWNILACQPVPSKHRVSQFSVFYDIFTEYDVALRSIIPLEIMVGTLDVPIEYLTGGSEVQLGGSLDKLQARYLNPEEYVNKFAHLYGFLAGDTEGNPADAEGDNANFTNTTNVLELIGIDLNKFVQVQAMYTRTITPTLPVNYKTNSNGGIITTFFNAVGAIIPGTSNLSDIIDRKTDVEAFGRITENKTIKVERKFTSPGYVFFAVRQVIGKDTNDNSQTLEDQWDWENAGINLPGKFDTNGHDWDFKESDLMGIANQNSDSANSRWTRQLLVKDDIYANSRLGVSCYGTSMVHYDEDDIDNRENLLGDTNDERENVDE